MAGRALDHHRAAEALHGDRKGARGVAGDLLAVEAEEPRQFAFVRGEHDMIAARANRLGMISGGA